MNRSALEGVLVHGSDGAVARAGLEFVLAMGVLWAAARRLGWLKRPE